MELGNAYLWIADYDLAKAHFNSAIRKFPLHASSFYGMLGVARWCLDEDGGAVREWRIGLSATYADSGGLGVNLPLLLVSASILRPNTCSKAEAEEILTLKTKDPRSRWWPGTLAAFVLYGTSYDEALALSISTKEFDRRHREWIVQYYTDLLEFSSHRISSGQLSQLMAMATNTLCSSFSDQSYFLSLIWSGEFFIARKLAEGYRET
jgi:hypothetical protein